MLIKAKLFEFMNFNFYSLKTPYVNFYLILIRLRKTVAEAFRHMEWKLVGEVFAKMQTPSKKQVPQT